MSSKTILLVITILLFIFSIIYLITSLIRLISQDIKDDDPNRNSIMAYLYLDIIASSVIFGLSLAFISFYVVYKKSSDLFYYGDYSDYGDYGDYGDYSTVESLAQNIENLSAKETRKLLEQVVKANPDIIKPQIEAQVQAQKAAEREASKKQGDETLREQMLAFLGQSKEQERPQRQQMRQQRMMLPAEWT